MYGKIYRRCNTNCTSHPKTNLNKELLKKYKTLGAPAMDNLVLRKLGYEMKMWNTTEFVMTEQQFQDRYDWFMKHTERFNIQLNNSDDVKFRHEPAKWLSFYKSVWLIEEILNRNIGLKRHIFGEGNDNFCFTELFLESESEFFQHHHRQISRTESTENIQFDSYFTLLHNTADFALNVGTDKQPLSDPAKL